MQLRLILIRPDIIINACLSISSLTKTCQFRWSEDQLEICSLHEDELKSDYISTASSAWCQIPIDDFVKRGSYDFVASRGGDGAIVFDISAEELGKQLTYASNRTSGEIGIKVRKRNNRAIFKIQYQQGADDVHASGSANAVSQQFPVKIRRHDDARVLKEPSIPTVDHFVLLPKPLSRISKFCDAYNNLSRRLTIRVNGQQILQICAKTQALELSTTFNGIDYVEPQDSQDSQENEHENASSAAAERYTGEFVEVQLETKQLSSILQACLSSPQIVLGLCHKSLLIFHCRLDTSTDDPEVEHQVTFYLSHLQD